MSINEVTPGDFLYLEEEEILYVFKSWEREGVARLIKSGGGEKVLPVEGKGYTFHVISKKDPSAISEIQKHILKLEKARKGLNQWIADKANPL